MSTLTFIHAVMGAGKSMHLLTTRHSYIDTGAHVMVFTSALDDRQGKGRVASRLPGLSCEAIALDACGNLRAIVEAEHRVRPVSAVFVDEVQFLTPVHIRQAAAVADELEVPVFCYGLKVNAFGALFGPTIELLLALADDVRELPARCHCSRKANLILRYRSDGSIERQGNLVEVGSEGRYVSVCRPCFVAGDIGPRAREGLSPKAGLAA